MDRIITNKPPRQFRFDYLDLFPYTIAALMLCGEIYILHQFVAITPLYQY